MSLEEQICRECKKVPTSLGKKGCLSRCLRVSIVNYYLILLEVIEVKFSYFHFFINFLFNMRILNKVSPMLEFSSISKCELYLLTQLGWKEVVTIKTGISEGRCLYGGQLLGFCVTVKKDRDLCLRFHDTYFKKVAVSAGKLKRL